MFIELHQTTTRPFFYLGSVKLTEKYDTPEYDPTDLLDGWWDEFHETEPDSDDQFIAYLVSQGYATEEQWDGNPNDTPLQVYL